LKVQNEKKKKALIKPIAYNVSNGTVCTPSLSNENSRVFRVNGKPPDSRMYPSICLSLLAPELLYQLLELAFLLWATTQRGEQ